MTAVSLLAISAHAFIPEKTALEAMLGALSALDGMERAIMARAEDLAKRWRAGQKAAGLEVFLQEYGLSTREGIAIMCLAEALLRIPDSATANQLIHGSFKHAQWENHLGKSDSWLVNASSWGLLLTGKALSTREKIPSLIELAGTLGDTVIREALKRGMRMIGGQFVLGETTQDALDNSAPFLKKSYRFSYDILGEGARSDAQAQGYVRDYLQALALLGKKAVGLPLYQAPGISIKLSALHPRYELGQKDRVIGELLPRLKQILLAAKQNNIAVSIDAEEASRLDISLMVMTQCLADPALAGWGGVGFVVQAYQKRAFYVIDYLSALAREHRTTIPLRLVKGAYWDSEIKLSQMLGLASYPVFTRKEYTDLSYLACATKILGLAECFYPQFATHNARSVASIEQLAARFGVARERFEFQRLHGMGEALHDLLVPDYACRIYAPVGPHKDLLAYLIRRLLENGANTSFVHLLMDRDTNMEKLLADPVAKTRATLNVPSPLPLPRDLYGDRLNSHGMDFGNAAACVELSTAIAAVKPAMQSVEATTPDQLTHAMLQAQKAFLNWSQRPVEERARLLETIADTLEKRAPEAFALLVDEAGKNLPDAVAEVREAADFCRYYARQARELLGRSTVFTGPTGERNELSLHARGVFGCISPWNFPLAIFTGQIVAALVTGNSVIAKPAEQTPRIAAWMVALMHEAGIPREILQLVIGDGETVGAGLVSLTELSGVVFTGSMETARIINRQLAQKDGPIASFIAETGGQNVMVVDSSALAEQAVDDIIRSAFGSAGQRCSALRVLYVQNDSADHLLALLAGAMQELRLGNPGDLSADIGPVIDRQAQEILLAHIERMKQTARLIAATPLPAGLPDKHYVAPHLFEIHSLDELPREVFGPVLHVIRFKAENHAQVLNEINRTGYGLTFGIHSRIEANIDFFTRGVKAGNHYVNRSMIGATVGVQPFGGEGLSGTGPKAGGPHYLMKFVSERAISVNTAAIGGNVDLLAGTK